MREKLLMQEHNDYYYHFISFISLHRYTLKSLAFLMQFGGIRKSDPFWQATASCPRLESLDVGGLFVASAESWSAFRHLWLNQLLSLRLSGPHLGLDGLVSDSNNAIPKTTIESAFKQYLGPSKIRHLELSFVDGDAAMLRQQLFLLRMCPHLESFTWRFSTPRIHQEIQRRTGKKDGIAELLQESMAPFCHRLVHLEISLQYRFLTRDPIENEPDWETDQILSVLEAKSLFLKESPLKSLTLPQNWFGTRSWDVVKNHPIWPTSLTILDLKDAVRLPGSAVQEMLCTLPNLKTFAAARITDMDVLNDPRPWICLGLVQLSIGIVITATEDDERAVHRTMFFERLGSSFL
ncbi:hypothetical protein BGZ83_006139 [Gryganskiella cystojenkinii]|nr:hypothetical protein BGZ83_006139 [Gryganskiella cystojenkinii]